MKKLHPPSPRSPNSIDTHLGVRIRADRQASKMTQEQLGQELGVTFQQIQKYEKGINRLSAARLYEICQVFGVPIASMFEDIPRGAPARNKNGRTASRPKKKRAMGTTFSD